MDTGKSTTDLHAPTTPDAIQLDQYAPFYLAAIANRWTAVSSAEYRRLYNLGVGEWRLLASLATFKVATSIEISKVVQMDAGSVSRSMRVLEERGLIVPVAGRFMGRNKPYSLTSAGHEIHDGMKELALARQQKLLKPLSNEQRAQLLLLLSSVYEGLDDLEG